MRSALLLLASASALTLAMAAPVLRAPGERLFGHEIVGRHHDAYTMVRQFEEPSLQAFTQPATDWPGAALARGLGGVVALNALVLASFPLAALLAFLLARHLGLPAWAAAAAGLAFAFSPAHVAHAAYHPHVSQIQWIPLYLLALARCLDRWTPGRAAGLLISAGLLALSNFYAGLFGVLLTPVAVLAYRPVGSAEERRRARRATWLTLAAAAAAGALYVLGTAGPLGALRQRFAFSAADLGRYGARWYSYLLPPVDHPLAGGRPRAFWLERGLADGMVEQQLYLGYGLLLLAFVGVALGWRRATAARGARAAPFLVAVAAAAVLGSLAPAESVGPWPAPALPAVLHPLLPMFRAYARLGIFAQLAVALLAGLGAAALAVRGRGPRLLAGALLLLAAIELAPFPPWRWHPLLPTAAHRWIAEQPGPWRLLDCLAAPPTVAGSITRFLPQPAALLTAQLSDCSEPGLPGRLAAQGYSHLLLRAGSPEDRWYQSRGLPAGLVEQRRFQDSRLLRIAAAPADLFVDRWQGFSWREYTDERSYRWLGPAGEWRLVNAGDATVTAGLELELWSLASPRQLVLLLDGEPAATLLVGVEPQRYRVAPLGLAPGRHRLDWRPQGPAVVPDEIHGGGDTRSLTVAVGRWRWLRAFPGAARMVN